MFHFEGTRLPDFKSSKKIDYDSYWKHRGFVINKKLKEREQIMYDIIPDDVSVLDIGCGNSLLPIRLKEKGCHVAVGDISELVLSEYGKLGLSTLCINLESIDQSLLTKKSDYIILSEVLEHLHNPEEVIATLKPFTDNFFITVPNSAFYRYRLHLMFKGRFFTQWVHHPSEHLRFWSHIDFVDWLKAQDVELISSKASNGFSLFGLIPILKDLWPNMFGHQMVYLCKSR